MKKSLVMLVLGMVTLYAYADEQCLKLTSSQAQEAQEILGEFQAKKAGIAVADYYCEYCEETPYPKALVLYSFDLVKMKKSESYHLNINGKAIDIAFIYLNGKNLAHQVGCETVAISKVLTF